MFLGEGVSFFLFVWDLKSIFIPDEVRDGTALFKSKQIKFDRNMIVQLIIQVIDKNLSMNNDLCTLYK